MTPGEHNEIQDRIAELEKQAGEAHSSRGPIAWMAANPVASNLLMLFLMIGGLLAIPRIRQEVFPEFELDIVNIAVAYPGASPAEVEQGILLVVEESVRGIDGVKRVTSRAAEGRGSVRVEVLEGESADKVLQDVKNAVDRIVTFPEDAERPVVSLALTRRDVLSLVIYGDLDEHVLRGLAEMAKDELAQDPNITLVEIAGARALEISMDVPLEKLRAHNLTMRGIADEAARASVELASGSVKAPAGEVLLRTAERRNLASEFEDIAVISRPDGSHVTLGDLAVIRDDFAETDEAMYYNGQRAVNLTIYRVGNEKPITISKIATQYMEQLRAKLPPTVGVAIRNDRSELYRDRLYLLLRNAGMGLVLVMIILGLFLEVRLAFWVLLGIPTSFLGALLVLPFFDVSINMISLFAFIIALGIVVDDAIVVGESVYYLRQKDMKFLPAAVHGTQIVAAPVVFSVLTNIVTFLPMLFIPGTMGKVWSTIPIVITAVFAFSLVESLFILPAHLAKQKKEVKGFFWRMLEIPQERFGRGLEKFVARYYLPFIRRVLAHRYLTLSIGFAALLLTFGWVGGGRLAFTFFPKVESDTVRAQAVLPYGSPVAETRAVLERLEQAARGILAENGGEAITRGIRAEVGGVSDTPGSHVASVTVYMVPLTERSITAMQFTEQWRKRTGEIPGLESLAFRFTIGPTSGKPIEVELSHPEPEILENAALEVAEALRAFTGVSEIDDGIARGKPQWDMTIKPAARSLGVSATDLGRQLRNAFFGAEVRRQQRGRNEVKVMVRLPAGERASEQDIENMVIRTGAGGEIPLREAAEVRQSRAYEEIKRVDGRRVLTVTADVNEELSNAGKVREDLARSTLASLQERHPLLAYSFEGEGRDQRESIGSLKRNFLIALVGLFAVLAIPFRSYIQALIILVAIPFGIVGAVVGHIVMGYDLSIISLMGIVALSGVVINDNIILIDTTNQFRAEGLSASEAIAMAPARRFRPVLLTSLTTFFGLAPIMLERSLQARFMIPMAISLGYGILFSTIIALVLVPALYLVVEDIKRLIRYIWPAQE